MFEDVTKGTSKAELPNLAWNYSPGTGMFHQQFRIDRKPIETNST